MTVSITDKARPIAEHFTTRIFTSLHSQDDPAKPESYELMTGTNLILGARAYDASYLLAASFSYGEPVDRDWIAGRIRFAAACIRYKGQPESLDALVIAVREAIGRKSRHVRHSYTFYSFEPNPDWPCDSLELAGFYTTAKVTNWDEIPSSTYNWMVEHCGRTNDRAENLLKMRSPWILTGTFYSQMEAYRLVLNDLDVRRGLVSIANERFLNRSPWGPVGRFRIPIAGRVPFLQENDGADRNFWFYPTDLSPVHLTEAGRLYLSQIGSKLVLPADRPLVSKRLRPAIHAWSKAADATEPADAFFALWVVLDILLEPPNGDTTKLAKRVTALLNLDSSQQTDINGLSWLRNKYVHELTWLGDDGGITYSLAKVVIDCIDAMSNLPSDVSTVGQFENWLSDKM